MAAADAAAAIFCLAAMMICCVGVWAGGRGCEPENEGTKANIKQDSIASASPRSVPSEFPRHVP